MSNFLWDNIFRRDAQEKELIQRLKQNILFEDLSATELRFIEKMVHERDYRPNELIFRQGEAGVGMYIIHKGSVNIFVTDDAYNNDDEHPEMQITELTEGDFFGEISLVEDNGRRTASARTNTDTRLIGFFKPDLMELLERNPQIGAKVVYKLAEVLGRRLAETTDKISLIKKELIKIQTKKRKA